LLIIPYIDPNENNWMTSKNIITSFWYVKYIQSFYWAVTIMMTIGFGDITPVNRYEMIVLSFL